MLGTAARARARKGGRSQPAKRARGIGSGQAATAAMVRSCAGGIRSGARRDGGKRAGSNSGCERRKKSPLGAVFHKRQGMRKTVPASHKSDLFGLGLFESARTHHIGWSNVEIRVLSHQHVERAGSSLAAPAAHARESEWTSGCHAMSAPKKVSQIGMRTGRWVDWPMPAGRAARLSRFQIGMARTSFWCSCRHGGWACFIRRRRGVARLLEVVRGSSGHHILRVIVAKGECELSPGQRAQGLRPTHPSWKGRSSRSTERPIIRQAEMACRNL